MRLAHVFHSKDGYGLEVESVPLWAWLVQESFDPLCRATRHKLCSPPEWTYKIGFGADTEGDPDWYRWSLGSGIWRVGQSWASFSFKYAKPELKLPLTDEQMKTAGWDKLFDWDHDEDDPAVMSGQ